MSDMKELEQIIYQSARLGMKWPQPTKKEMRSLEELVKRGKNLLRDARTEAKREAIDDTNYALKRILFENLPAEENYDWFEKEFDNKAAKLKED